MEREKQIVKLQLKNNELAGRKDDFIQNMGTLDLKTKWLKNRQDALTELCLKCQEEGVPNLPDELKAIAREGHNKKLMEERERDAAAQAEMKKQ